MTVYIAENEVPKTCKVVRNMAEFFECNTCIPDTLEARQGLSEIEGAGYFTEYEYFNIRGEATLLNKSHLSRGCKAYLNVLTHPDICFQIDGCNYTALSMILQLNEGKVLINNLDSLKGCEDNFCRVRWGDTEFRRLNVFVQYVSGAFDVTDK